MQRSTAQITDALAAPFDEKEVKFKPSVVNGNRALALAYVDARVIQDRLDDVLGVAGWQDEYECLPDGSVVCRLKLLIGSEWITKMDVGGESEQKDEGDRRKAAFSDALKRAAVKFGVGRYLYRLPQQWCDYDPQKRAFRTKPTLSQNAINNAVHTTPQKPAEAAQSAQQPAEKPRPMLSEVRKATVARLLQLAPAVAKQAKTTAPAVTEAVLAQIGVAALDALDKPQVIALRAVCDALEAGKPIAEVIPALTGGGKGKQIKGASEEQLARLDELSRACAMDSIAVRDGLRKVGATSTGDLTEQQATRLIGMWEQTAARLEAEAASIEVPR